VFIFAGVFITALVFVIAGTTIGWLIGTAIDTLKKREKKLAIKRAH